MNIIFIIVEIICLSLISSLKTSYSSELVCNSIDIRNNVQDFYKLNNCTRIEGYLRIVLIQYESWDRFERLSFPALKVITDYLLLFRVFNLRSLANLFPNLTSIRGHNLFFDYAFVINYLPDLQTIGLNNLKHIRGGVRFENNSKLCLANTRDYQLISNAVKSTHSTPSKHKSSFSTSITIIPISDHEISFNWDSKQNSTCIPTKYIITLTEIEDSNDFNNQLNHCNNSLPSEAKYKREYHNCVNENRPQSFILNTAEHQFETRDQFSRNFHKTDIYVERGEKKNEVKSITSMNSTKFGVFYHIKNMPINETVEATNNTSFNFSRLKHFTPYLLKVEACHHIRCHILDIKKTKTWKNENADNINESSIKYLINNNSILIEWEEPKDPNGMILCYEIKYQELSNNTLNANIVCINQYDYRQNNKSYQINDLNYNMNYSFKLRAKSIAGYGKWSHPYSFTTDDIIIDMKSERLEGGNPIKLVYITIILIMISCAFILIAIICYIKSPAKEKHCDVISINPEYEKFIVDPYWELKKSDIRLLNILGNGAFGRVFAGELTIDDKVIKCAVKTLNSNARSVEREDFLKEAHIMKSFVDCHHIVKLLGIVSIENPVLVLMEFMANGDLKSYLRLNRPNNYENPNACMPSLSRILQMAIEISDGMSYLSFRKFVHRDLAARNCMVSHDLTVKIGDFGMTRDIYDSDYYRKRDCGLIPVRWMSPESLRDGVFTSYSDIWSYGVVLYEMVTLGSQPYQGLSNEYVYKYVISGGIMKEPENCPKIIWKIVTDCWRKNPKHRPTFAQIIEKLLPSANQRFREVSFHLNHKQQSFKKIWDNLSAPLKQVNNFLYNGEKQIDNYNEDNNDLVYFPMNPKILINNVKNNEIHNNRLKSLNQMNEIQSMKNFKDKETQIIKDLSNKESELIEEKVIPSNEWQIRL